MTTDEYAVGIDFGTSKSALSYIDIKSDDDKLPRPLLLYGKQEPLPSCVFVDDTGDKRRFYVGDEAIRKFRETGDTDRYFTQFKLDLGDRQILPDDKYARLGLSPEVLMSVVIRELLEQACLPPEGELSSAGEIKSATITIPAKWSIARISKTQEAALAAGLESIRFAKEPTAALHYLNREEKLTSKKGQKFLVVDYGGGTCDVTACETFILGQDPKIIGEGTEDTGVGGREIDRAIANLYVTWASEKWNVDPQSLSDLRRLWEYDAEEYKKYYVQWYFFKRRTGSPAPDVQIRGYGRHPNFTHPMSIEDFDQVTLPIVRNMLTAVRRALAEENLKYEDINHVYLVGGGGYLPTAQSVLEEVFGNKVKAPRDMSRRFAVCFGAALWQYYKMFPMQPDQIFMSRHYSTLSILQQKRPGIRERLFRSVPTSSKVSSKVLIKKGPITAENRKQKTLEFVTPEDNMQSIYICIVESDIEDQPSTSQELILREELKFGKALPKGTKIRIKYSINLDDRLELYAEIVNQESSESILIEGRRPINPARIKDIQKAAGFLNTTKEAKHDTGGDNGSI